MTIQTLGLEGNDSIYADGGDDTLIGGKGNDQLMGEEGNDTYIFSQGDGKDSYIDSVGNNIIRFTDVTSTDHFSVYQADNNLGLKYGDSDEIILTDFFVGDENRPVSFEFSDGVSMSHEEILARLPEPVSHTFIGDDDNNIIKGTDEADVMQGGTGNDNYYIGEIGDVVIENANEGTDTVRISRDITDYQLQDNFERMLSNHKSGVATNMQGNDANNIIYSGRSDDTIDGAEGQDGVSYAAVKQSVHVNLSMTHAQNTGDGLDTLINIENLYGSHYDDVLTGDENNNYLNGLKGNDTLIGHDGNDTLKGYLGDDTLIGGAERDVLIGGEGKDCFVFESTSDSSVNLRMSDVIKDFTHGQDIIHLSAIDADSTQAFDQSFELIDANQGFTQAGQLQFIDGVLYGNTDSDLQADFAIKLDNITQVLESDFIL